MPSMSSAPAAPASWRQYAAELIGTFALVFIGAGAVTVNSAFEGVVGVTGIALAHGLVLMSMIYALGSISGTHVNPAVSISLWAGGQLSSRLAIGFVVSQLVGAALAGLALLVLFPDEAGRSSLGLTTLASGVSAWQGLLLEAILTFFLVSTVWHVAVRGRGPAELAGVAIGLVLTFDILMGGAVTGASMNPARTFGPALASLNFANHWVYWVGPIAGGLIAVGVARALFD